MSENAKFRLQKVLEVRELIEKERQKELSVSLRKLKSEEEKLLQLEEKKMRAVQGMSKLEKVDVNQFASHHSYLTSLRNAIADKQRDVRALAKEVEKKRLALMEATKNRKALENLKSRQQKQHELALTKKEQALIDDVAIRKSNKKLTRLL